jgi:hypothetical protein
MQTYLLLVSIVVSLTHMRPCSDSGNGNSSIINRKIYLIFFEDVVRERCQTYTNTGYG